jgi:hypothetical protein
MLTNPRSTTLRNLVEFVDKLEGAERSAARLERGHQKHLAQLAGAVCLLVVVVVAFLRVTHG